MIIITVTIYFWLLQFFLHTAICIPYGVWAIRDKFVPQFYGEAPDVLIFTSLVLKDPAGQCCRVAERFYLDFLKISVLAAIYSQIILQTDRRLTSDQLSLSILCILWIGQDQYVDLKGSSATLTTNG